jgi:hypothetical protein
MEHILSTAFAGGKPVTFEYTIRHAIARGAGKQTRVCLKANHEEAEEGARLEFVEHHGFEPEEIEAWPVLDSMIS